MNPKKLYTIYTKEYEGKKFYKVRLSKKDKEGKYINAYMDIRFKGEVDLPNKTQIYLKDWFLSFYLTKDNRTVFYIQVMSFEQEEKKEELKEEKKDGFEEFGEELKLDDVEIAEEDLPF